MSVKVVLPHQERKSQIIMNILVQIMKYHNKKNPLMLLNHFKNNKKNKKTNNQSLKMN